MMPGRACCARVTGGLGLGPLRCRSGGLRASGDADDVVEGIDERRVGCEQRPCLRAGPWHAQCFGRKSGSDPGGGDAPDGTVDRRFSGSHGGPGHRFNIPFSGGDEWAAHEIKPVADCFGSDSRVVHRSRSPVPVVWVGVPVEPFGPGPHPTQRSVETLATRRVDPSREARARSRVSRDQVPAGGRPPAG